MSRTRFIVAGGAALFTAILILAFVAATGVGGGSSEPVSVVQSEARAPAAEPTQVATQAAPQVSAPSPTVEPSPVPPTPAVEPPSVSPPAAPVSLPDRTDCAEIRGTEYRSESEEAFFRANCIGTVAAPPSAQPVTSAPAPPPPAPAASNASAIAEAEARYRSRASAQLAYFVAQMKQAVDATTPTSYQNYILTVSSLSTNFINALDSLEPVPPRFQGVHSNLRAALVNFRTEWLKGQGITTQSQFVTWLARVEVLAERADQAIASYNAVVGTNLPRLR